MAKQKLRSKGCVFHHMRGLLGGEALGGFCRTFPPGTSWEPPKTSLGTPSPQQCHLGIRGPMGPWRLRPLRSPGAMSIVSKFFGATRGSPSPCQRGRASAARVPDPGRASCASAAHARARETRAPYQQPRAPPHPHPVSEGISKPKPSTLHPPPKTLSLSISLFLGCLPDVGAAGLRALEPLHRAVHLSGFRGRHESRFTDSPVRGV